VQINRHVASAPVAAEQSTKPEGDLLAWYWDAVPHTLNGAGVARFAPAMAALDAPEAQALIDIDFQRLTDITEQHGTTLLRHSIETGVGPAFALAVIYVESRGEADAVSSAGATGLMQLIPATAARFDVTDPLDPAQNIAGGMTYLSWLLENFKGDPVLALAGYNAGENSVIDAGACV